MAFLLALFRRGAGQALMLFSSRAGLPDRQEASRQVHARATIPLYIKGPSDYTSPGNLSVSNRIKREVMHICRNKRLYLHLP